MLQPNSPAPDFTLPDQDGQPVALADLKGRWVLLWWYRQGLDPGLNDRGPGPA